jgi:hypothetical protein
MFAETSIAKAEPARAERRAQTPSKQPTCHGQCGLLGLHATMLLHTKQECSKPIIDETHIQTGMCFTEVAKVSLLWCGVSGYVP